MPLTVACAIVRKVLDQQRGVIKRINIPRHIMAEREERAEFLRVLHVHFGGHQTERRRGFVGRGEKDMPKVQLVLGAVDGEPGVVVEG